MEEFYIRKKEGKQIYKSAKVTYYNVPYFLTLCDIRKNCDGSWTIKTSKGEKIGIPGEAYWVLYGENSDSTPNGDIITKDEMDNFIVCDEEGNDICLLSDRN